MYIFDSIIAKVSIPFTMNKIDDKREWYYLKNSKDENIICLLLSIYCDYKDKNNSMSEDKYLSKSSNKKHDISCDVIKSSNKIINVINKSNNSYIEQGNKTKIIEIKDQILNKINNSHLTPNRYLNNSTLKKSKNTENTVTLDSAKSPNLSLINSNLFSPNSYRMEIEKSAILSKTLKNEEYLTTIDSVLENKVGEFINDDECNNLTKKIQDKYNLLKDDHDRILKIVDDVNREKESIILLNRIKTKRNYYS
jgi:hypothetical protein